MKLILLAFSTLIITFSFGQDFNIPLKDGLVVYEKTDSSSEFKKDVLFVKSMEWLSKTFENAKYAIELSDKDAGLIISKGNVDIIFKQSIMTYSPNSKFTLKINVKDNKFRVQVFDITSMIGGNYTPIETSLKKYGARKQDRTFFVMFDMKYNTPRNSDQRVS